MSLYGEGTTQFKSMIQEQTENGLQEGANDLSVGFFDRFSIGHQVEFTRFTQSGRKGLYTAQYEERDKLLMDEGLIDQPLVTRNRFKQNEDTLKVQNFQSDEDWEHTTQSAEELVRSLKQSRPDLKILTDEEIEQNIIQDQQELLAKDQDLQERSTFMGKVGYLAGVATGWARDPVHIASLLAGGTLARGAGILLNMFRIGSAEVAVESVIQSVEKSKEVAFRRLTGEDVSTTQALQEVTIDVGLAGTIGSVLGGVGGFVTRALPTPKNPSNVATDATAELLDNYATKVREGYVPTAKEAQSAELLDETVRIMKSAPEGANYEKHLSDYASARRNLTEGTETSKVDEGLDTTDVDAVEGSRLGNPEVAPDEEVLLINEIRNSLEVEDITLRDLNKNDEIIGEKSAREVFEELDADERAITDTINCLSRG